MHWLKEKIFKAIKVAGMQKILLPYAFPPPLRFPLLFFPVVVVALSALSPDVHYVYKILSSPKSGLSARPCQTAGLSLGSKTKNTPKTPPLKVSTLPYFLEYGTAITNSMVQKGAEVLFTGKNHKLSFFKGTTSGKMKHKRVPSSCWQILQRCCTG